MPRLARHCYLVADGTGWTAFVPIRGGYVKTHWCVVVTTCPHCKAGPGHPCEGADGLPKTYTHYVRRDEAQKVKRDPKVRARLLKAVPAVTLALDTLAEAFR